MNTQSAAIQPEAQASFKTIAGGALSDGGRGVAAISDGLLTEKEAAAYLRIKVRQLYNWRVSGMIPYIRIGKALRYRKSAIDQTLERFTRGPAC